MSILDPFELGGRTLPSRVVFGPIVTNLADGRSFSDRHRAFYRERAAGGCGLIVTEYASVHRSDWPYERCPEAGLAGPGWQSIASACDEFGVVTVAGLSHAGGQSSSAFSQREIWAPSDEPDVNTREVPKVMEQADIDEVVAGFARAAGLAVASGLAGVEINGGQHSLLRQFLSGLTNRRQDRYGSDRLLFARQVLEAVRAEIGEHILGLRLSCDELAPWAGITPESAVELAVELAPLVDYLVVVRGAIFSVSDTRPTAHHPPGFNLELASRIRSAVDGAVPVIAQGSIVSIDQAERAVADGHCDAVEMTRAQLADADLVTKARRTEPPRPCVLCNQLCNVQDNRNPIISCIADPRCGHETTANPEPPARPIEVTAEPADVPNVPKLPDGPDGPDVIVVGGGPAGLEAARVAARCGFAVRLYEACDDLGGMARLAATAPAHGRLLDLVSWLEDDGRRHGVDIRLGETMDPARLREFGGDVILATGSRATPPSFELAPQARVVTVPDVLSAAASGTLDDVLDASDIAIWDPIGGPAGVAVAELVAGLRQPVRLITPDAIAGNLLSLTGDLAGANTRLQQTGVEIVRRQRLASVNRGSLDLVHVFTGERSELPAGIVIDASARQPNDTLWDETGRTLIRVGDAVAPRTVGEAIREGREAGLALSPAPVTGALSPTGGRNS